MELVVGQFQSLVAMELETKVRAALFRLKLVVRTVD
jgi:hypothetical protein